MVAPSSTRKGLPSTRSCSGRGRGKDLLFLAELEQDPPCPVLDAGRWSCHRRLENRPSSPQPSPARDTFPLAGLSSSSVCYESGTHSGTVPTGRGSKRRDPRKHGWQPWRGARLRQDQDGSTGKSLADTRAPSSLRRARCGRAPPKSYATAFGLESAHAPLLAKTHPMNCTSP